MVGFTGGPGPLHAADEGEGAEGESSDVPGEERSPESADEATPAPADPPPQGKGPEQGTNTGGGGPKTLPEIKDTVVVTATGESRVLSDSPLPVRVVDQQVIRESGAGDVAELLRRAPGLPALSEGVDQRGGAAGLSLQGLSPNRTLVLVDGRPVGGDVGGVVDLAGFPAALLDRVEVVEGPMSALYGSDALGGVINLVPRKPPIGLFGAARAQGATDKNLAADLFFSTAYRRGVRWSVGATVQHGAPLDLDAGTAATDRDGRTAGTVRIAIGGSTDDDELDLSFSFGQDARTGRFQRTNAAIDLTSVYDTDKSWTRGAFAGAWTRRLSASADLRVRGEWTLWDGRTSEGLQGSLLRAERHSGDQLGTGQIRFAIHHLPGLSALVGLDVEHERLEVVQDRVDGDGATSQLVDVAPTDALSLEPWIQGDLRLFADRVELLPGLRLATSPGRPAALAPSLAVRVKLWRDATLRLSGAGGYRVPSLKERHLVFDHAAYGYLVEGEPALKPERSWGVQLSFEQRFGKVLTVRGGAFANRLHDLIAFVLDPAASTTGLSVFRATNVDAARTGGFQADLDLNAGPVRLTAAGKLLFAQDDFGRPLPDAPRHSVRVSADLRIPKAMTLIGTAISWESERVVDPSRGTESPGMVLWDARVHQPLPIGEDTAIFVSFENLLDQHRDPAVATDVRPPAVRRVLAGIRLALGAEPPPLLRPPPRSRGSRKQGRGPDAPDPVPNSAPEAASSPATDRP